MGSGILKKLRSHKPTSTLGFKYPSLRDYPLHSAAKWLEGKQCDDGAEGLWRVHDGIYDLSSFINKHPGGPTWLKLTKGTDITEAFEVHHLNSTAEKTLSKFFVHKVVSPRNSPFTFKENGFYKTLKREIVQVLETAPTWPEKRSKIIADLLLFSYLSVSFFSIYLWSYRLGVLAGVLLANLAIAAHNFFHRKDNFRMYYFDLSFLSSRSWRVTHVLSHHMYTNTITDFEISVFEPFFQYLPGKNKIAGYFSWLLSAPAYSSTAFINCISESIGWLSSGEKFPVTYFLPLAVPLSIMFITGTPFLWGMLMYTWIIFTGSFYFGLVGVNAAHHHPEIFHDGDAARPKEELDWGVHQLDAVMDRNEITGSHFLVITNFGDHALHHLFPTIDHGLLNYLYPALKSTCEKFGVQFRMKSQLELFVGQFKQLVKTLPNSVPPPPLKIIS